MGQNVFFAHQRPQVVAAEHLNLVLLVAGAEAIEEVQEGHPGTQRGGVRGEREIMGFLHAAGTQHRPAGHPAAHHIGVISEDAQRVRGNGASRHVNDRRSELTGDLVHIRDHQQQALRSGEGRSQGALGDRAVQRARCPGLGLHLDDLGNLTPDVRASGRAPGVRRLGHRRRGRDGVDRDDLAEGVRHARGGLVPVHRLPCSCVCHVPQLRTSAIMRGHPSAKASPGARRDHSPKTTHNNSGIAWHLCVLSSLSTRAIAGVEATGAWSCATTCMPRNADS